MTQAEALQVADMTDSQLCRWWLRLDDNPYASYYHAREVALDVLAERVRELEGELAARDAQQQETLDAAKRLGQR